MEFFKSNDKKPLKEGGKTIIASGCVIEGKFVKLEGNLLINGVFKGDIISSFDLAIGEQGEVKGSVKVRQLIVTGLLEANVVCDKIEILKTGTLKGDLVCNEMVIESKGKFVGNSSQIEQIEQNTNYSDKNLIENKNKENLILE